MRILITRPEPDGSDLAYHLAARGHECVVAPMLSIEARPEPVLPLDNGVALVITSRNAVRAIAAWPKLRELATLPVFCVGARTQADLEDLGFRNFAGQNLTGDDLANTILNALHSGGLPRQGGSSVKRLIHLSGADIAGDLVGTLRDSHAFRAAGLQAERFVIYEAVAAKALSVDALAGLEAGQFDAALFYSPRTARIFLTCINQSGLKRCLSAVDALCLSDNVAAGLAGDEDDLRRDFRRVRIAEKPKGEEMLALIDRMAAQLHQ